MMPFSHKEEVYAATTKFLNELDIRWAIIQGRCPLLVRGCFRLGPTHNKQVKKDALRAPITKGVNSDRGLI